MVAVSAPAEAFAVVGTHAASSGKRFLSIEHYGDDEHGEAARYTELAKIDVAKAMAAAQARVSGKVLSAALDNEDGKLVYNIDLSGIRRPVLDVTTPARSRAPYRDGERP